MSSKCWCLLVCHDDIRSCDQSRDRRWDLRERRTSGQRKLSTPHHRRPGTRLHRRCYPQPTGRRHQRKGWTLALWLSIGVQEMMIDIINVYTGCPVKCMYTLCFNSICMYVCWVQLTWGQVTPKNLLSLSIQISDNFSSEHSHNVTSYFHFHFLYFSFPHFHSMIISEYRKH